MSTKHKSTSDWMDDGDSAHWIASKSNKKRPARKASSAGETKKRFKANTLTVKAPGKKKTRIKK